METTCLFGIPVPRMNPKPEKALYSNIKIIQNRIGLYAYVILNPIDQQIIAVNIVGKMIPAGISVKTLPQKYELYLYMLLLDSLMNTPLSAGKI